MFLRSWYPVSVPQFYNPITSLLLPVGQKDSWEGMRTLGQLKHDLGIRNKPKTDALYKVGRLTIEEGINANANAALSKGLNVEKKLNK